MMESAKLKMGTKAKEIVITRLNCAGEARERSQMRLDKMHKLLIFDQLAGSESLREKCRAES